MNQTIGEYLVAALRNTADAYAAGDQAPPCAVLWPDPEELWQEVIPKLQRIMPELFVMGGYAPDKRTGPALWLRCIEARVVDDAPSAGITPIFYLPGLSRAALRTAENCTQEVAALVEVQYRGVTWLHANGKEWTPYAFLVSKQHGGLGLDAPKDEATLDALSGALPWLISQPLSHVQGKRLDSEYFNALVAPDPTRNLLSWLSNPESFKQSLSDSEWKAFCQQCRADLRFDPVQDGPLTAAKLLAERTNSWDNVWKRFAEAPQNHLGVVEWLKKAAPKKSTLFETAEVWPNINEMKEQNLLDSLKSLVERPQDEAIHKLAELEKQHAARREYPWQKLKLSPLATVLEPLAKLAHLCQTTPGAPTSEKFAEYYFSSGWRVDAAALDTMAACESLEHQVVVCSILRAVYLPWLESTSRHLQKLVREHGSSVSKRAKQVETAPGRLVLFADGLRMDVAKGLAQKLGAAGIESKPDWEWSTIPSITAIAKPAASPIADATKGGEAGNEFSTRLASTSQTLTPDRFVSALMAAGWQGLRSEEIGDPSGSAWTEAGTLDKRGHNEGWKLARFVDGEIRDLVSRISVLLKAGWTEIIVVTDHGWLLMPGGLPKIELKAFLTEHQWGRCAALKEDAKVDTQTFNWHWDHKVPIASPPGVGCYRSSVEYSHGGVSLQEMVTPVLRIARPKHGDGATHLLDAKWTGAKCGVIVGGETAGFRVDVRTRQSDASTSLLSDKLPREIRADGKVTVFLEDDSDIGKQANIVLLDATGQVIDAMPTTLGK